MNAANSRCIASIQAGVRLILGAGRFAQIFPSVIGGIEVFVINLDWPCPSHVKPGQPGPAISATFDEDRAADRIVPTDGRQAASRSAHWAPSTPDEPGKFPCLPIVAKKFFKACVCEHSDDKSENAHTAQRTRRGSEVLQIELVLADDALGLIEALERLRRLQGNL